MTEDEMVEWHHRLNGQEFEQALEAGDGQGSLACCSPWGRKELGTTERPNWTDTFLKPSSLETLTIRFLPIGVDMMWRELPVLSRMDFKFILPCFQLLFSKILSVVLMKVYQSQVCISLSIDCDHLRSRDDCALLKTCTHSIFAKLQGI